MKRLWITESGIIHHRKPRMDATEYVEVNQQPDAPMNDLKTVRDALRFSCAIIKFHVKPERCIEIGDEVKSAIDTYKIIQEALTTLSRMIETPAPQDISKAIYYPECWDTAAYPTVNDALAEMFTWFKCDNPEHAAPTPAPTEKVDVKNECALEWTYSNHAIQESIKMFPYTWETIRNALKCNKHTQTEKVDFDDIKKQTFKELGYMTDIEKRLVDVAIDIMKMRGYLATTGRLRWGMEDKLLPCPFCGEQIIYTEGDYPQFFFECSDEVHCGINFNIYADSEKTAFDCMNTRAPIGDKNDG